MTERRRTVVIAAPAIDAIGGVTTHLHLILASRLTKTYEFRHFQVGSEGRRESFVKKVLRALGSPLCLVAYLRGKRQVLLHVNTSMTMRAFLRDSVYLLVAKALRRAVVFQIHGGLLPEDFWNGRSILRLYAQTVLRMADTVVVLGEKERQAYERIVGMQPARLIPNAIDFSGLDGLGPKEFRNPVLTLGYIGRLARTKGILESIEALGLLAAKGWVQFRFRIAGTGEALGDINRLIARWDLIERVEVLGVVRGEAKWKFWRDTDVFLLPTYHLEGLPYSILESLASGTPVLTTRVAAIPDAVRDGREGVFVAPRNPEAIAEKLRAMTEDREWLQRMSRNCVERAHSQYGLDKLEKRFDEVYASAFDIAR